MKTLYIKITEQCNMHCPFCYIKQKPGKLSLQKAIKVIDSINPDEIIFHGGEPLLYPKLINHIINHYQNKIFSITSNLTLPLTEERINILKKCRVATSYSIDRFNKAEDFLNFTLNLFSVIKFASITILVTLSREQLKQDPKQLGVLLERLPHTNILFERLYEEQYDKKLAEDTDKYLCNLMSIIPEEENILLKNVRAAIKYHIPVFPLKCNEDVFTLNPNGTIDNCPNLCNKQVQYQKRRECLTCDFYEYCKGDCLSFQNGCMFPKKTVAWIKDRRQ